MPIFRVRRRVTLVSPHRRVNRPRWLGMHRAVQGLADPRAPQPIEIATLIRFATGLEARYIVVEAASDSPGELGTMLCFIVLPSDMSGNGDY